VPVRTIKNRVSIASGSTSWKPTGKMSGDNYKIRITSNSNAIYTDTSDGNFTINPRR
jgi:hypothetical protein